MKKKHIIYAVMTYILSKISYYTISLSILDLNLDINDLVFVEIVSLLCFCYFLQNLWRNTTEEMLEGFTDSRLIFYGEIIQWVIIILEGNRFGKLYYKTGIYESNPPMFIIILFSSALSMLILFHFMYKSFCVTFYKNKEN